MSLETFHDGNATFEKDEGVIDIVAIHDLGESGKDAWSHRRNGANWLQDFLPFAGKGSVKARIWAYNYRTSPSILLGDDAANGILQHAQTLISILQAERSLTDTSQRPLVFICHGFGGIIVKKALAYSATQISNKVSHNYSIYVSTYGILFLGTPHNGYEERFVRSFANLAKESDRLEMVMARHREMLQVIADQFAPLMKQFHIYLFWEQNRTRIGRTETYVVKEDSAAPLWIDTDRAGCSAVHSDMCKFETENSSEYKTILEALIRYSRAAPDSIAGRWKNAIKFIHTQRSIEAAELIGFDVHNDNKPFMYLNTPKTPQDGFPKIENRYFLVPRSVSSIFTGQGRLRNELQQRFFKRPGSRSPSRMRVFVLYGLGGSGKTQFCLKFVQEHREDFWAVFWIDASSTETAERTLSYIGKLGGLGESHQAGVFWLAGLKLPWLLVIDNADDPSIDYSRFFPGSDQGHVLLTSRLHDCKIYATIGSYEFRDMDKDDAVLLLLKAAGEDTRSKATIKVASQIVKVLGYLPLALTQAGASIRQNICSLDEYLELYQTHKSELLKRQIIQNSDSYHHSTFTTFDVTIQRIEQGKTRASQDAIEILQILAFFHFEQVPMSIFHRAWRNMQRWPEMAPPKTIMVRLSDIFGLAAGLSEYSWILHKTPFDIRPRFPQLLYAAGKSWDSLRLREAIAILENHSLIFKGSEANATYSMHPLVQFWARNRLSDAEQRLWTDIATNTIVTSIDPDLEASSKPYRITLIPHINSCLRGEHACTLLAGRVNPYQISKSIKFASVYSEGGTWKEAIPLQEYLLKMTKMSPDLITTAQELDITMSLADSYWNLDQVGRSLKLLSEVINGALVAILGAEDPRILRAKDKLASAFWLVGHRQKACELSEGAVEKLSKLMGTSHPYTLDAMDTLGRTLLHLGRAGEARIMHQKALDGRKHYLGPSHPDTLMAMANLGMSLHALGDLDSAEGLLGTVLEERARVLGEEHAYTLWAVNDLAKIRCDQGRAVDAEAMLTGILEVVIRTLGEEHIGMSMTRQNIARAYIAQEKWTDAEEVLRALLKVQNEKMPPQHPDKLVSMMELAKVMRHLGRLDEAEQMLKSVIEISIQVHGQTDYRTQKAMGQLAATYIAKSEIGKAEALDKEIGEISEKNL